MGIAEQVQQRAAELTAGTHRQPLDDDFVKACLDANERGDGVLFATLHHGNFLYNTTPKDGQWLRWAGNVWEIDDFRHSQAAVEEVALEYEDRAIRLSQDADQLNGDAQKAVVALAKKYRSRVDRLRTDNGSKKVLSWAPIVDLSMACKESDLDRQPWLLPVRNGVIDLRTGALVPGHPSDMMTRALDISYDPSADYESWCAFVEEVSGSPQVASFLKRFFGYSITGHSFEQYIAVFIGSGRNGKGVLFSCLAAVLGPYYHVISPGMITEQKIDPSPNAASEHKYALMGKRLVVAGESKRGQRIDAGQLKGLTGDDAIECRPNFGKVVVFQPTHTLALHTNHMPTGIGSEFSLIQRLLKIDFPWSYVDDPEAEERKCPPMADRFRKKDKTLKEKLLSNPSGILRWLVEGCLEWQKLGLAPPPSIMESVDELAREADYLGQFINDCLVKDPHRPQPISFPQLYQCFLWWWRNNQGDPRKAPANRTVARMMRDIGFVMEKRGGKMVVYGVEYHPEVTMEMVNGGFSS